MLLQRKNFASRQPQTIKSFFLVIEALTNGQKQAIRCTPKYRYAKNIHDSSISSVNGLSPMVSPKKQNISTKINILKGHMN